MGLIKKFQCQHCQGIVETEFDDEYVICGHCESACQVPLEFGPGVVIDDFVIAKLLGEGGMGNVYLAHQFSLDRKVALKILKDDFLRDPKFKDEFIYEARNVACLNHPNIIQAYKVGEENGIVFFAMEYVEGRNLKDILKEEGAINEKLAISIAMEIVSALGYAWNLRKLVHRDIKPENIMMTNEGTAKLMDLGLSLRDGDNKDDGDTIAGTPQYISPEQILGTDMDIRGDFYCLGATLYHLVSGKLPFEGSLQQIVKSHLSNKPESLRKAVPGIDDFFAKIIHKMMAKKPENRYESSDALLAAFKKDMKLLEDAEQGKKHFKISTQTNIKSVTQTSGFQQRKRRDPLLTASLVMLAILILGFAAMKIALSKGSSVPDRETAKNKSRSKSGNSGNNSSGNSHSQQTSVTLKAKPGLRYKYYHMTDANSSEIGPLVKRGETDKLFVGAPDSKEEMYWIIYDGFINIPYGETYKFYVKADDVCNIRIRGNLINGRLGKEETKQITLDKGVHPIQIEFAQYSRGKYMDISIESISVNKRKLPMEWMTLTAGDTELKIDESKKGIKYKIYKGNQKYSDIVRYFPDEEGIAARPKGPLKDINMTHFVEYEGLLKVPKPGMYTFYLSASNWKGLSLNGVQEINATFKKPTVSKEVYLKNTINLIKLLHRNNKEASPLKVEVEGEGLERQEIPEEWFYLQTNEEYLKRVDEAKLANVLDLRTKGKLNYKYFNTRINNLERMRTAAPTSQNTVENLTAKKGKKEEDYSIYFFGKIRIPGKGKYTFTLDSDDLSLLTLDGKSITSDSASDENTSKTVGLSKGEHDIEVFYNQGVGGTRLNLYVQSDKIPRMKVPSSWYSLDSKVEVIEDTETPPEEKPEENNKTVKSSKKKKKKKGKLNFNYYEIDWKDDVADLIDKPVKSRGTVTVLNYKKGGRDELYGLYFYGYIDIPESAEYTFYLSCDDRGLVKIGGSELLRSKSNKEFNSTKKFLKAGKHKFEFFFYQNTHGAFIKLDVESKSIKRQRIPSSWYSVDVESIEEEISLEPEATEIDDSFEAGLRYTLHKSSTEMESIDEMLKNRVITKSRECSYIRNNVHSGSHDKNYGLVYEGYFYAAAEKTHTFGLTSNDGSRLYLGDKLIIDHDGTHEAIEKKAEVKLKKGLYKFRLEYFQELKARELLLKWKNNSGEMINVPERVFYRKKVDVIEQR